MSPAEMEKSCHDIIESYRGMGFDETKANITLVTPPRFKRPPKFPRGYLLQVKDDGQRVWHFPAVRVLAWLRANTGAAA